MASMKEEIIEVLSNRASYEVEEFVIEPKGILQRLASFFSLISSYPLPRDSTFKLSENAISQIDYIASSYIKNDEHQIDDGLQFDVFGVGIVKLIDVRGPLLTFRKMKSNGTEIGLISSFQSRWGKQPVNRAVLAFSERFGDNQATSAQIQ